MKRKRKCIEKKSFGTLFEAKKVTYKVWLKYHQKLNVYECPICLDFHLTKQSTKIGCLLNQKIEKTLIDIVKPVKKKKQLAVYIIARKRKNKSLKIFAGRMHIKNIIEHNYALMRRHLKGLQPKVKTTLKGQLSLQAQKEILALLNN
jgi:hypothetical protein